MKKRVVKILIILMVIILAMCIYLLFKEEQTISTNSESLSSKKIEWGIKRGDNNMQPDVGTVNKQLMEESDSIYIGNKDKKIVYLTFDLGYEAGYTDDILNTLKENEVTGTLYKHIK